MKPFYILLLFCILTGCHNTPRKEATKATIPYSKLSEIVFETGGNYHLREGCEFEFRCDCCSGHLQFHNDSTFYAVNYCETETSRYFGTYTLTNDTITVQ
ncbi:hypothetical protein [Neptunitalea chrysea]|uniref:hypothetical protein n=1 Tax=Neptunitalea chrysea TaxID=1647581 RepID=UPI002491BF4B|nr:hypothetical protein [Neptunitalea chrysea]